jgi:hypothetical protein
VSSAIFISENIAYLPGPKAAVTFQSKAPYNAVRKTVGTPVVESKEPVYFDLKSVDNIAYWGDSNLFPQQIIKLAEKSTELPSLLDWKARAALGKEILPFTRTWDSAAGTWKEEPILDSDILGFFQAETTKRYYREAYSDFYWFNNVFPDLIKNEDLDQIAYIGTHDASWCRWYKMNDKGVIDKAMIASNWEGGYTRDTLYAMDMDVVDPYKWNLADEVMSNKTLKRFIYPISYPSPGRAYYQLAPWDGFRTSGWMDLAAKIPEFKTALMKNQMQIKYHIIIPDNTWADMYPDWDALTDEQQAEKKRAKVTEINNYLSNAENAGKSLISEYGLDDSGNPLPQWKIDVIDDKLKDGAYIEDSQEASAHLLRALSLDGTLVGQGPGRNLNAGGGAEKLIAYNMYVALLGPPRDVINAPVLFAARCNGWIDRYPSFFIKTIEAAPQALDTSKKVSYQAQEQDGKN